MKKIEDAVRELGGVWPSDDVDAVYLYRIDDRYIAGLEGGTAPCVCTRTEFEQCTRRLRNEPSWDYAPSWAVAKAQDSDGEFYWYEVVPRPGESTFISRRGARFAATGEVIGDWRDTLRLRPEEKKVDDKNDWHKRGEFPPVGAQFEFSYNGSSWDERVMLFNDGITCLMAHRKYPANRWHYKCDDSEMRFRPLQTERERWVEMARKATFEADEKQNYYEAIYDAGLAKMPEDE